VAIYWLETDVDARALW